MSRLNQVVVPNIGNFDEVPVIEILIAVGDSVEQDQTLITLESDKTSLEVPSPYKGIVRELTIKLGDLLSEGAVVALIENEASDDNSSTDEREGIPKNLEPTAIGPTDANGSAIRKLSAPYSLPPAKAPIHLNVAAQGGSVPYASPVVRVMAREWEVELTNLVGTGRMGRITKDDMLRHADRSSPAPDAVLAAVAGDNAPTQLAWPTVDFAKFGDIETVPLSRVRKISGANLSRNWARIPHVTQHDQADITELEVFRQALNLERRDSGNKITLLTFILKACATALARFPSFNASLDPGGEALILKKYIHLGFAADTQNGLMVPVIRHVDRKGIVDISHEISMLASKAGQGKLEQNDISGGCFTVSSLGSIGGLSFTPIVNAPDVAILGVSKASMQPVWDGRNFVPRLLLPLSLSYDHRVIDGAAAARFTAYLAQLLADMRRVLL